MGVRIHPLLGHAPGSVVSRYLKLSRVQQRSKTTDCGEKLLYTLSISGFESKIILKSFLYVKGATLSEKERNILKHLLMSYVIMKQSKG